MYELIEKNGKKVMIIDVEGQKIELKFTVRFNREADTLAEFKTEETPFGAAVQMLVAMTIDGNLAGMSTLIYCGTWDAERRPKQEMIDNWLDNVEDVEQLQKDLLEALEASNVGKLVLTKIHKMMNNQQQK